MEARLKLIETLVDNLPVGVVLLDAAGKVVLYNQFEEQLSRRPRSSVVGRDFFSAVAPCTDVRELAGVFREKLPSNTLDETVEFRFNLENLPRARDVLIRLQSFELGGEVYGGLFIDDVTAQRRLTQERDAFYRMLVHDMKGGLTGILCYADLLASGSEGPLSETQRETIELVAKAGDRLRSLIEVALTEFRGELSLEGAARKEPVNLHALVLGTARLLTPAAEAKGVTLRYEQAAADELFPERSVTVLGDVDRLGALVDNLVTNALKYAQTQILVSLEEDGDDVHLVVRDDGAGIAEPYRERVFEPGFQVPDGAPGQGLGLASVRQTAERHAGQVWADVAPEGGAALHVKLPGLRLAP